MAKCKKLLDKLTRPLDLKHSVLPVISIKVTLAGLTVAEVTFCSAASPHDDRVVGEAPPTGRSGGNCDRTQEVAALGVSAPEKTFSQIPKIYFTR